MTPAEQLASGTLSPALVLDVFLKLGIVLILIYVSLRLLRRYGQQAPVVQGVGKAPVWLTSLLGGLSPPDSDVPLRTLQIHPLNRQVTLYLLEVDSRRLLLSVTPTQVQLLKDWESGATPVGEIQSAPATGQSESENSQ